MWSFLSFSIHSVLVGKRTVVYISGPPFVQDGNTCVRVYVCEKSLRPLAVPGTLFGENLRGHLPY
ncbi:hypothetical protein I7I50_06249 [Histoplasma capsulatum G186AR]|uniref:Uncharacterized protein n=1 Tax=Ajellomyces capsulatus TaxID=5037 RepID=A0A8H8D439_AJECA|nr:hypothetical protein I7I52_10678 [Histoplasma capsulatum]QSS67234.1 hypothetical protein I7I50_06249 [Histoplasma capsulatum G186AR]